MSDDGTKYTCGECHGTTRYRREYDSDMPEGWYQLEDRGAYYVLCSVQCLARLVKTLEADQADPSLPASGVDE